ncbi:MAG: hypothetical protein F6J86_27870 [Symploca sp. SIO1B1]|nr:hypothetical protein [Symploca sp. SIO1B1]
MGERNLAWDFIYGASPRLERLLIRFPTHFFAHSFFINTVPPQTASFQGSIPDYLKSLSQKGFWGIK